MRVTCPSHLTPLVPITLMVRWSSAAVFCYLCRSCPSILSPSWSVIQGQALRRRTVARPVSAPARSRSLTYTRHADSLDALPLNLACRHRPHFRCLLFLSFRNSAHRTRQWATRAERDSAGHVTLPFGHRTATGHTISEDRYKKYTKDSGAKL